MASLSAHIPPLGAPFLDANGNVSRDWHYFLSTLRERTGGAEGVDADATESLAGWGLLSTPPDAPQYPDHLPQPIPADASPRDDSGGGWLIVPEPRQETTDGLLLSLLAISNGGNDGGAIISAAMRPVVRAPTLAAALVAISTPVAAGFAPAGLTVSDTGTHNGIVGQATNNAAPSTSAFPAGVTGYGSVNSAGNQAYGIQARADLTTAGVAANLLNSRNAASATTGVFPPPLTIGTTDRVAIAALARADGSFPSNIAYAVALGTQPFLAALYAAPGAATQYGLLIDADGAGNGPATSALIRNYGGGANMVLQTMGGTTVNNGVLNVVNAAGTLRATITQAGEFSNDGFSLFPNGILSFKAATTTASASSGAGSALPGNPRGYVAVLVNGVDVRIPYYNP